MCCLLIIGCIYLCKQRRKNTVANKNEDEIQIIHKTSTGQANITTSTIHQHHYYHHTVQLSEDVVNTIQFNDNGEEGEETEATIIDDDEFEHDDIIDHDDEKENIQLL